MNLIIDIGNTRAKLAVFIDNDIIKKNSCNHKSITNHIKKLQKEYDIKNCIISSVAKFDTSILKKFINLNKIKTAHVRHFSRIYAIFFEHFLSIL